MAGMELQAGPLRVVTGARYLLLAIIAGALAGSLLDASDPRARPGSGSSATSARGLPEGLAATALQSAADDEKNRLGLNQAECHS